MTPMLREISPTATYMIRIDHTHVMATFLGCGGVDLGARMTKRRFESAGPTPNPLSE